MIMSSYREVGLHHTAEVWITTGETKCSRSKHSCRRSEQCSTVLINESFSFAFFRFLGLEYIVQLGWRPPFGWRPLHHFRHERLVLLGRWTFGVLLSLENSSLVASYCS